MIVTMNKTQAGRLLTLAYYLKTETISDFDMSFCNKCAIAQCSKIWPKKFKLDVYDYVMVNDKGFWFEAFWPEGRWVIRKFFGLNQKEFSELFVPRFKDGKLPDKNEVAQNIKKLVNRKGWVYA